MSIMTDDIKPGPGSDTNGPMRVLCSGKPYLYFNSKAEILDCNEESVTLLKISKNDLLNSRVSSFNQNKVFVDAVYKAGNEGVSVFRGNVLLGYSLSLAYIETVFFSVELPEPPGKGIICYILDYKPNEYSQDSAQVVETKKSDIADFLNTSVSLHSLNGDTLYISPSIETLLGYSFAELKELGALDLVFPEDAHIVLNVLEKLHNGVEYMNSRYRMVRKNGLVINVESSSYLISDVSKCGKHIINVTWDLSSLAKTKQKLVRSEQKYYRLVMNLPTGISLISTEGQLLEVNDAMKKIMGIPLDIPLNEMNFFTIDAMKRANITEKFIHCIEKKEIINGDTIIKQGKKKNEKFLTYSFVPVLNQNNNVDLVIGYVSDLTKQKKAESESHEKADFLNLVINTIKIPFFVKDEHHKWVMLNDAAVEMMGQTHEALLGKSDYDLYPKEQADVFWKYDELVFKTGSSSNEEEITWSDDKTHTIVTNKQLYLEKQSGRKFIVGTIHDISSYKKIEEKLRASEMKYRELFNNANDFIITLDLEGNITNANRTLLNYLQTDLKSFMQYCVYDFISDEHLASVLAIRDQIVSGNLEGPFEVNAIGMDKQPVIYEVKASVILKNGILVGIQCVFSDITRPKVAQMRLKEYNQNLLELNKTKDKFFSIIAHDLRNPFSSLIGFSELLLEDLEKLSTGEIRDYLKIIRNSAKNSLNLLENLLAWSRLETGRMPFDPVKIILTTAVEEVVDVLFSLAYRKKIDINNLVEPDVLLHADKNMLNTILNNLVMNAIKFTPIGGEIKIFTEKDATEPGSDKEYMRILVSDNGIGIEDDMCEKLFLANKPSSRPGTEKEEGTGLGLLLSREMVDRHGGKLMVESTPGIGSVFSFLMPIYKP